MGAETGVIGRSVDSGTHREKKPENPVGQGASHPELDEEEDRGLDACQFAKTTAIARPGLSYALDYPMLGVEYTKDPRGSPTACRQTEGRAHARRL